MTEEPFIFTPDTVATAKTPLHQRFPAAIQLGVLAGILLCLLGGALLLPGSPVHPTLVALDTAPLATTSLSVSVTSITPPPVTAKAVYVYDVATDRVLYAKNADTVLPLASITKLMTTLVATELVQNDTTATVPAAAAAQMSSSGLQEGERLTSGALANYALLASSNDAAYTLAAAVGALLSDTADPQAAFVAAMNIKAEELGLNTMTFKNATGLDLSPTEAGAYGTAADVTALMRYILREHPALLSATTVTHDRIATADGSYHDADNTNPVITQIPHLIGSKTGFTDLAGGNLTIAYHAGFNRPIIITVLGSTYDDRFTDVLSIVDTITNALTTP